jgi:Tol biopolymer transport system component/DNA-binding winged helix-turn-helix (wHTH) protein
VSAAPAPRQSGLVSRFGVFTLDHASGELFKHGVRLRLGGQPFQILCLLIERQGEVVTREEIRAKIWPGTFVDFDGALNTAIRRIRSALGDTAENPRFVETVPKLGYRFIVPVETGRPGPVVVPSPTPKRPIGRAALAAVLIAAAAVALVGVVLLNHPAIRVVRYTQITNDGEPKTPPLVTDGVRLYYNVTTDSGIAIAQVPVGGVHPASIIWPGYWLTDLSRSGAELLANDQDAANKAEGGGPLWILPLPAGPPRKLGIDGHGRWSPDGTMLAYAKGPTLFVAQRDGTNSRVLTTMPGLVLDIAWSPDGRTLRLGLLPPDGSGMSIWQVSVDGSGLHRILGPDASHGAWSPDAQFFVFNQGFDLWAMRGAGPKPFPLTAGPIRFHSPAFSPGGKSLFAVGEIPRGQVVRYDRTSGQLLPYLRGISADGLVFARDGEWVAYTLQPDNTLWRSRIDGSDRLQLTFDAPGALYPRWSPDGTQIAYTRRSGAKGREKLQICLVPSAGGTPRELAPADSDQSTPAWDPAGKRLAFAGAPWMKNWAPDSTAIRVFDFATHSISKVPGSDGLWAPKWSPDGRYIVAETANSQELMLWDWTAERWTSLARVHDMIQYTAWSHDSKYVYFNLSRPPDIFRVRLADGAVEPVLRLKDFRPAFTGGYWFGLTPDDSILLSRDTSVQEIYRLDLQ